MENMLLDWNDFIETINNKRNELIKAQLAKDQKRINYIKKSIDLLLNLHLRGNLNEITKS